MTAEQFVYWLQGFFELSETITLNEQQVAIVKEHINLVLKKQTSHRVHRPLGGVILSDKKDTLIC